MNDAQILARLDAIAQKHLQRNTPLRPELSLAEDVAQDSLARMTLLVEIENEFRICVQDDEAQTLHTVQDAVLFIRTKLPSEVSS